MRCYELFICNAVITSFQFYDCTIISELMTNQKEVGTIRLEFNATVALL